MDGSLILGCVIAAATALLAGTSGFGFALVATPLLLLSGFALPFVVTVNLLIAVATRVSVAWRTGDHNPLVSRLVETIGT